MKIKINVVNDNEETSVQDEDYLGQQVHTIGQPVHVGDVLLIKVRNKLFKCEVQDSEAYESSISLFSVKIYPLDEDDKKLFENDEYRIVKKRDYMDGTLNFYKEIKHKNGDTYWEIDFTKGYMGYEVLREKNVSYSESLLKGEPFTVVKFLRKSIPTSAVQDNDLTEYKPSIKPLKEDYRNVFNPSQAIGEPVEDGDTFLIKAADKSFKCEIHETDDLFKNHQNLFTARIYPLDKDDVSIAYEDYFEVVLIFDQHVENHDHYVIDFTKGKISPVDYIPIIREDTPFTVTKFLAHSGKNSTVQDNDLTEYRNSIKPHHMEHAKVSFIGNPVHPGDVLLIKAEDKLFKCEIQDAKYVRETPTLFSVKIYPLDKDDKNSFENDKYHTITKRKYIGGLIDFDENVKHENGDTYYEIDFAKGILQSYWSTDILGSAFDEVPFTVVKFLTRSVPASTVQDSGADIFGGGISLNYISEDSLDRFSGLYTDCIDFKHFLELYVKAIEEIIYNDEPSHEYDNEEDPKDREYKDYLEKVAFCIPDIIYSLKDLIKEIRKR